MKEKLSKQSNFCSPKYFVPVYKDKNENNKGGDKPERKGDHDAGNRNKNKNNDKDKDKGGRDKRKPGDNTGNDKDKDKGGRDKRKPDDNTGNRNKKKRDYSVNVDRNHGGNKK